MKKLILILLFAFSVQAQVNDRLEIKFRWKKWNESKWFTEDKFVHCFGGWILNNQLDKARPWWQAFLIGQGLSIAWEIKDSLIRWEEAGFWGGDGFDWKDHIAVSIGQLGQGLFDHVLFKKTIYSDRDKKIKKRLNKNLYIQR